MRWLIDGNNVVGARPDRWWRDRPAARRRLVEELERWQRACGDDVVVIFDGPADPGLVAHPLPGLTVAFSGSTARDSADSAIVARAAADARPDQLTVVSSDRGLAERLPAGVHRLGAGAFRRLLDGS